MSEVKHTPGPWEAGDGAGNGRKDHIYCDDATGSAVATCHMDYVPRTRVEVEANARLIAAAPDLLAALITAERIVGRAFPNGQDHTDLRAAIARATEG